ncbi:MAG: carbon-nitrogen hydrolase family protein [Victivallales bacterium]|jgi:deaminated glutathione amidase|nr:carbon-nitrogen hydrolase family protein [Victivallales bacterium]
MSTLRLATAQFPVCGDIARNLRYMVDLLEQGKREKVDIVHFSEACLGGYAGGDFKSWDGHDWGMLQDAEDQLRRLAGKLAIGIVYGTNRRVTDDDVRNSLIYVSPQGERAAEYDKRFCTGGDLKHYVAGQRFATFELNGFICGLLICYDVRFPELYREYKKLGVKVMCHSFYNARAKGKSIHTTIMRPTLQARAATNHMYVSGNNSSGYYQSWPSVFIVPDGTIVQSCRQHRTGLILNDIDSDDVFYDASGAYRERAMAGILHSE